MIPDLTGILVMAIVGVIATILLALAVMGGLGWFLLYHVHIV